VSVCVCVCVCVCVGERERVKEKDREGGREGEREDVWVGGTEAMRIAYFDLNVSPPCRAITLTVLLPGVHNMSGMSLIFHTTLCDSIYCSMSILSAETFGGLPSLRCLKQASQGWCSCSQQSTFLLSPSVFLSPSLSLAASLSLSLSLHPPTQPTTRTHTHTHTHTHTQIRRATHLSFSMSIYFLYSATNLLCN
jgi:hypothetical protein